LGAAEGPVDAIGGEIDAAGVDAVIGGGFEVLELDAAGGVGAIDDLGGWKEGLQNDGGELQGLEGAALLSEALTAHGDDAGGVALAVDDEGARDSDAGGVAFFGFDEGVAHSCRCESNVKGNAPWPQPKATARDEPYENR